jgi:DNA-binding transcriptional regulator of glucitol operon
MAYTPGDAQSRDRVSRIGYRPGRRRVYALCVVTTARKQIAASQMPRFTSVFGRIQDMLPVAQGPGRAWFNRYIA